MVYDWGANPLTTMPSTQLTLKLLFTLESQQEGNELLIK